MQIHTLRRAAHYKAARRVGRGGKRGTYSGRGIKGQRSRAGAKIRPAERDVIKKIPKLRGYKFRRFRSKAATVALGRIHRAAAEGDLITPRWLLEHKMVRRVRGRLPRVKVLGSGASAKKLRFTDVAFSASAAEALGIAPPPRS